MAGSGIVLFGFLLAHMLGNLKLYQGPEKLNAYAEWLRDFGHPALPHSGFLWIARVVLLLAVVIHVLSAVKLTLTNRRARPQRYFNQRRVQASYASRTMLWSGGIIAAFVVYHLLHFTTGSVHPSFDQHDVYRNVVLGFSNVWASGFYVLANTLLGVHLSHALWSMIQTLGWNRPEHDRWWRAFAWTFASVITLGNVSLPLSVLTGLVS